MGLNKTFLINKSLPIKLVYSINKALSVLLATVIGFSITACGISSSYVNAENNMSHSIQDTTELLKDISRKFNYDYELLQINQDLIFKITVINITDSYLNIPKDTTPYAVFYKGNKLASQATSYSTPSPRKQADISLAPKEAYTYQFMINEDYPLLSGTNIYQLQYVADTFEHDLWQRPNAKYFKRINFIWDKNKQDNKGRLIEVAEQK